MEICFFIAVDAYSKWPEVIEMAQVITSKTVDILRYLFSCYGLSEQIVSDNGPQFISSEFNKFMKGNGIKNVRCSPYHPLSNGAAGKICNFLLKYHFSPNSTNKHSTSHTFLG